LPRAIDEEVRRRVFPHKPARILPKLFSGGEKHRLALRAVGD
jgi:hypothetical protein